MYATFTLEKNNLFSKIKELSIIGNLRDFLICQSSNKLSESSNFFDDSLGDYSIPTYPSFLENRVYDQSELEILPSTSMGMNFQYLPIVVNEYYFSLIKNYFVFNNWGGIKTFFSSHPFFQEKLVEAREFLEKLFIEKVNYILTLRVDAYNNSYIICSIDTKNIDPQEAISKLEFFDKNWLIHNIHIFKSDLIFQLE